MSASGLRCAGVARLTRRLRETEAGAERGEPPGTRTGIAAEGQAHDGVDPDPDPFDRCPGGGQLVEDGRGPPQLLVEHGGEELVLAGEVAVEGAHRHARQPDHRLDLDVLVAAALQGDPRRVEDARRPRRRGPRRGRLPPYRRRYDAGPSPPGLRCPAVKPSAFEYHAPTDLDAALATLGELGDDAKVIAGGQSLVPMMSLRLASFPHLVDLGRVPELRGVGRDDGFLRIAAMTTQAEVEHDADATAAVPLLGHALPLIGHFQIRNRGTIGGSIAHADPASELPAVALALDAELDLVSAEGTRTVAAAVVLRRHVDDGALPHRGARRRPVPRVVGCVRLRRGGDGPPPRRLRHRRRRGRRAGRGRHRRPGGRGPVRSGRHAAAGAGGGGGPAVRGLSRRGRAGRRRRPRPTRRRARVECATGATSGPAWWRGR